VPNGNYNACTVIGTGNPTRNTEHHMNSNAGVWIDHRRSVIEALRGCENLILFGPGEAKGELNKRLAQVKLGPRVAAVETTDKMTDPQIAAKVRAHFADPVN
jgi:hypothetical protein